jgi:hypothetical protein
MPPLLVALPVIIVVIVVVIVIVVVVVVFVVIVIRLRLWLRIRLRIRLWIGLGVGLRRLRSGRWAGVWLRRHIVTDQQGKPTTAALRAFWGQRQDNTPLDVRRAGSDGQDQEKVFHHSFPNLSKAANDLRYDFIKRSICSTFHLLGSIRVSSSSRYTCSAVSTVCVSAASSLIAITAQASR